MTTYTVKGTIKDQKGQPQQGLIIRATDKDFTGENALGSPDSTDASGAYCIVYNSDDFVIEGKETTVADLIIRAFDSTGQLLAKSKMLRGSEQSKEQQNSQMPVVIDLVIGTDSDAEDISIVRGRITVGDAPTKDIEVKAFDKDLPSRNFDEELGSCKTDAFGNYYIPYSPKKARSIERGTADVYIEVKKDENMEHPDASGTEGGQSDTRYNVGREVVIDLALTAIEIKDKPAEYDNYWAILSSITEGVVYAEDIDFLTNETGINAAHLEYLRLAQVWTNESKIAPQIFYGLLRTDFPTDMALWVEKKQKDYETALEKAVKENIIANWDVNIADIISFVAQKSLKVEKDSQPTVMQTVLSAVLPNGGLQLELTQDLINHDATNGDFWVEAEKNELYGEFVPKILFGFDVSALTYQNEFLTQRLLSETATNTVELVVKNNSNWVELMPTEQEADKANFKFPDTIKGETHNEKRTNYATRIMETLESNHPREYVMKELEKPVVYKGETIWETIKGESQKEDFDILNFDTTKVEDKVKSQIVALQDEVRAYPEFATVISASGFWTDEKVTTIPTNTIKEGVKTFFNESLYNFKQPIGFFLQQQQDYFPNAKEDSPEGKAQNTLKLAVEKQYRVRGIAKNAEMADIYLKAGVTSATNFAYGTPVELKGKLIDKGVKPKEIQETEDTAKEILVTGHYIASELFIHFNHTNPRVMGSNRETLELTQTTEGILPTSYGAAPANTFNIRATYENLFGSTSSCSCDYCRSVYSPTAYFVDFMWNLLKDKESKTWKTPAFQLLRRRPDLRYLKLNCENTNTRVPYIDLVNEIFEIYIAYSHGLDRNDLSRNSIKKAEEVAKEPEYLVEAAYAKLNEKVFPLTLPFDKDFVTVQTYLTEGGTSLYDTLVLAGETNESKLVSAIIGLNDMEYTILTNVYNPFYKILAQLTPDTLQSIRIELGKSSFVRDNFESFLDKLKNPLNSTWSADVIRFYDLIKDMTLSDSQWRIFKQIFIAGNPTQRVISPAMMYGLSKNNEHYGSLEGFSTQISPIVSFLQKTNISFQELDKILKTTIVNKQGGGITWTVLPSNPDACKIENLYISYRTTDNSYSPVSDDHFVMLNRFIRLWKKLGCTIEELDYMLATFFRIRYPKFDDQLIADYFVAGILQDIAYTLLLQKQLNWSLKRVVELFDTGNDAQKGAQDTLLKKLGIKMSLLELNGIITGIFTEINDPKQLHSLLLKFEAIRQAGFKAEEVKYLLTNISITENEQKDRITNEEVLNFAKKLRDGLRKIAADTAAQPTLTADFIVEKLKLVYEDVEILQLWSSIFNNKIRFTTDFKLGTSEQLPNLYSQLTYNNGIITFEGFGSQMAIDKLKATLNDLQIKQKQLQADLERTIPQTEKDIIQREIDLITQKITYFPVYSKALDLIPAAYKKNIIDAIGNNHSLFLSISEVEEILGKLEKSTEDDTKAVLKIIFDKLYFYLTDAFIAQTVSNEFKLDVATTHLLIHTIHPEWKEALKANFVDVQSVLSSANMWLTPPKTEEYTFTPSVVLEVPDSKKPLIAGKYYKVITSTNWATIQWEAKTFKKVHVAEQYLFSDKIFTDIKAKMLQFDKFALLVQKFKLQNDELEWIVNHPQNFDYSPTLVPNPNPNNIKSDVFLDFQLNNKFTFHHWQRLADYTFLKKVLNDEDGKDLLEVFRLASLFNTEVLKKQLLYLTQWKDIDLGTNVALFTNEVHLLKQYHIKQFNDKYGFLPSILRGGTPSYVKAVKDGILSKYEGEAKDTLQKRCEDKLRALRRNALMDYIIHYKNIPNVKNANDLYEYFLIDVEMEPCMTTSRIVQANATLQLFAQRVLMNLESPSVKPEHINQTWYDWMHKYRVWEANRKVFLYPENWIEPELRDDKSEIFKALESELLQGDVTHDNAVKAVGTYLYALDSIARLDVRAFCGEVPDERHPYTKILHVVARTFNVPHIYYYRHLSIEGVWSPWEKMDVGVEGDQIAITMWKSQLIVFWLSSAEKELTVPAIMKLGTNKPLVGDSMEKKLKYIELGLNWCFYQNKKWSTKKSSKDKVKSFIEAPNPPGLNLNVGNIKSYKLILPFNLDFLEVDVWSIPDIYLPGTGTHSFVDYVNDIGKYIFNDNLINPTTTTTLTVSANSNTTRQYFNNIAYMQLRLTSSTRFLRGLLTTNINGRLSILSLFKKNYLDLSIVTEWNLPYFLDDKSFLVDSKNKRLYFIPLFNSSNSYYIPFEFINFYHPYSNDFLLSFSKNKLFEIDSQNTLNDKYSILDYSINLELSFDLNKTIEIVDFTKNGTYSSYNWEVFFHIPMLTANRLSQNQRYQEAQQWYHYIFNPTTSEVAVPTTADPGGVSRYWQFLPFRKAISESHESIVDILKKISTNNTDGVTQLNVWRNDPFNPHAIARLRIQAYMRNVVGKYIENLINWGDSLFRQDTMESINEATQLYILAANILGPRPIKIPRKEVTDKIYNYAQLKNQGIDAFANVLENHTPKPAGTPPDNNQEALQLTANQFYFCIPDNTFILKYWDTVADRLFKIRHCQNIEGVERQLDLFEPEIDPALLVRAKAMGMDIGSILRDMQTPMPHYRFNVMLQKALELCAELRGLGNSLLSAIEKKEGEALSMMRQKHEVQMLDMVREIKMMQVRELRENLNGLNLSLESASKRYEYYSTRQKINFKEREALTFTKAAHGYESIAQGFSTSATVAFAIPQFHLQAMASGTSAGGEQVGKVLQAYGSIYQALASQFTFASSMAKTDADYDRRKEDWDFQKDLAQIEKRQIDKQILAAEIRINIAERELQNHEQQIENTRQIEDFLRNKFTNQELYGWMEREVKTLYNQCYQMVYDYAKRAEKTYRHELGVENTDFIRFGAWDSNRSGLLAGERLHIALKQMEKAYLEANKREFEITKHISLRQINPIELLRLRETGKCSIQLPEVLFDMDFPGHYKRRIKTVSISIPCIAGPYTGLNATLRLMKNEYRKNATEPSNYAKSTSPEGDKRFIASNVPSTAIAVSTGQNDSGLFELNFRDERYLPFEGAGAISEWQLELPEFKQFDYNTISEVVLHIRYTALEAGGQFKTSAAKRVTEFIDASKADETLFAVFDLKHDFPTEWYNYTNVATETHFKFKLDKSRFPYFVGEKTIELITADVYTYDGSKFDIKNVKTDIVIKTESAIKTESDLTLGRDMHNKSPFLIIRYKF